VIRKSYKRICSPLRALSFASLTFASNLLKNEFVKYRNCTRLRRVEIFKIFVSSFHSLTKITKIFELTNLE
jgi:hypothetical protein